MSDVRGIRSRVLRLFRRLSGTEQLRADVTTALETGLSDVYGRLAEIDAALWTPPHLAAGESLTLKASDGRDVLGYDGARNSASAYAGFEDVFRGSEAFIRDRQRVYLPLLSGSGPVVDLGCGRGEMLDLLKAAGVDAVGVDSDPGMVQKCRERGHDVVLGDALAYLRDRAAGSVGAVFSAQFVEHISTDDLLLLLDAARTALRPGGTLVAETVNPHSVPALRTFWVDLTHQRPIFPETLLVLCRERGYASARILFPAGTGDLARDRRAEGEYAIVATTPQ